MFRNEAIQTTAIIRNITRTIMTVVNLVIKRKKKLFKNAILQFKLEKNYKTNSEVDSKITFFF